ncbi:MAG: anaerobic ribonucleoside-triphosphate reductase activating protein [Gammaproteobacteria bacterium]|nr:anaerobic ribonucleoside-triphosphate reductase activating protein [Gammaproteobacteria bacterium]MBU1722529.1 anaerobic ribonucleoside-triphosphate reductase activating protein [Gammaproteobacteria bacterium]MBU2004430.1 anaerobic ribonucleoside-triphosphate reductase activating protein [Gammaproteobacteria bacterium]
MVPLTTIDFPGHLAAVLFCQGCPWHCRYCHNPHLLPTNVAGKIPWAEVISFLQERVGFLDGVVFSGGEPLLQPRLPEAMQAVKALGFKVALHTAGIIPARLAKVLPLVDWVGLDIKAPLHAYKRVTGLAGSGFKAEESLDLLLAARHVDYEIRTTVDPGLLGEVDIQQLTTLLARRGVKRHVLQDCRPALNLDKYQQLP